MLSLPESDIYHNNNMIQTNIVYNLHTQLHLPQYLFRYIIIVTAKKYKFINQIKYLVHLQLRGLNWVHFYGSNFLSLLALLPHIFLSSIILPNSPFH